MSTSKPIILEVDGIFGQLPNGALINAGGTSFPTFTVGGKGLLFDDGTSTSTGSSTLTLQSAYDSSPTVAGAAGISLESGKDFIITDSQGDGNYFRISGATGKVTISGDVEILGTSTVINTVIQDSDHWLISPKNGTTTALKIEPDLGVVPIVDLVSIRRTFGSAPVFRIDAAGNLIATQNLTVGGLINGVDIVALRTEVTEHDAGTGYRHEATGIDILPISTLPGATNVQQALEQINNKADSGGGGSGSFAGVYGYSHIQTTASSSWTIIHNRGTFRAQVTIYDINWEQIIPEQVKVIDNNTVLVSFAAALVGRAMVLLF
jgi:hypothetical protein